MEVTDELAADRNYRFLCYGFGNRSSKKRRTEDGEAQFLGSTAYRWIPCMGAVFCRILGIREQKGGE